MNKQCSRLLLVGTFIVLLGTSGTAFGDVLLYDFATGAFVNPVPASSVPANTTASNLTGIAGIQGLIGNPGPSGGPLNNFGLSGTNFVPFTITPNAGFALNVLAFSFDERNLTANGPTGFDVYTSVNGFATSILGGALAPNAASFTNHSVALGTAPFLGITGPLTVHISGFGGPAPGTTQGLWLLDNITLTVDAAPITAVPEPSTLNLHVIGAVGLLRYGWRRWKRAA